MIECPQYLLASAAGLCMFGGLAMTLADAPWEYRFFGLVLVMIGAFNLFEWKKRVKSGR